MNPSPLTTTYVSALSRAKAVKILLAIGAVFSGLSLLLSALSLMFPTVTGNEEFGENPGGVAIALISLVLVLPTIGVNIATIVFFLMWEYRSYKNLPAFGAPTYSLGYSPGWAIGSFFVPFVNLVVPYRAIRELWRYSVPGDQMFMGPTSPPAWFPVWWTFWLLSNFANNIYFRMSFRENIDEQIVTIVGFFADSLSLIAALLAIVVVSEIAERQEQTSGSLGLGKFSGPPAPPTHFGEAGPSSFTPSH